MRTLLTAILALVICLSIPAHEAFTYGGGGGGGAGGEGGATSVARGDSPDPPSRFEPNQLEETPGSAEETATSQTPPPVSVSEDQEDLSELIEFVMVCIALSQQDKGEPDASNSTRVQPAETESDADDGGTSDSTLTTLIAQALTQDGTQTKLPDQMIIATAGTLPGLPVSSPATPTTTPPSKQGRELTPEEKDDVKLYQDLLKKNNDVIQHLRSLDTPLTKEQENRIKQLTQWNREYQREIKRLTKPYRLTLYDHKSSTQVKQDVEQCLRDWRSGSSQGVDTRWMSWFWKGGCVDAAKERGKHVKTYLESQIKAGKLKLEGHTVEISVRSTWYILGKSFHSYTLAQIYDKHGNHVGSFEVDTYVTDRIKPHDEVDWSKGKGDTHDDAGQVPPVIK
jgi:hypothetical protein